MAGGFQIVLHADPLFPAETTTTMPAASAAFSAGSMTPSVCVVQPSDEIQPHELSITSGALLGSPCAGVPATG